MNITFLIQNIIWINIMRILRSVKARCPHTTGDMWMTYFTIMPDTTSAVNFLEILYLCHSSIKFTMETESKSILPFLSTQLLNKHSCAETKVYIKPTNTGLLQHYKSHVVEQYKNRLLKTMLDHDLYFNFHSIGVTSLKNVIHWNYCFLD